MVTRSSNGEKDEVRKKKGQVGFEVGVARLRFSSILKIMIYEIIIDLFPTPFGNTTVIHNYYRCCTLPSLGNRGRALGKDAEQETASHETRT